MSTTTLLIIGAAVIVFVAVLVVLARTGRKPIEGPAAPVLFDEPLPEPAAATAGGISAAEVALPPALRVADGPADPLARMKGLGPRAEAALNGLGITRYDQIAAWSEADVTRIDAEMGAFRGRIVRDRWVEQAAFLAKDDVAGFEAVFGKLG